MAMVPDEQGIFYVLVVGGGPGAGEFIYDASGNLRSSNVGQPATDPVQGVSCPQGFATYNGHGAVINLLSTSKSAFFQYLDNGTSTQGQLILSVASTASTDPITGQGYIAGLEGIDVLGSVLETVGPKINLGSLVTTQFGQINIVSGSGAANGGIAVWAPEQGQSGHLVMFMQGVSPDGTKPAQLLIASEPTGFTVPARIAGAALVEIQGPTAAPADPVILIVAKAAGDLSSGIRVSGDTVNRFQVDSNGSISWGPGGGTAVDTTLSRPGPAALQTSQLNLSVCLNPLGAATPSAPGSGAKLWADASGFLRMLSSLAGDTNAYLMAYQEATASATPQTISSTSATTITGCTFPVGIGKYAFKARVTFSGGSAAGTANFSVSGPANTSPWINALFIMTNSTGVGAQNAALGPVNSPTLTTGNNVADIEGEATFTAAGTIALQCAEGVNLDTVIIQRAHFWLYPIL